MLPSIDTIKTFFNKLEKVELSDAEIANIKAQADSKKIQELLQKYNTTERDAGEYYNHIKKMNLAIPAEREDEFKYIFDKEMANIKRLNINVYSGISRAVMGLKVSLVEHPRKVLSDYKTVDIVIDNTTGKYDIKPEIYIKIKEGVWGYTVYHDKLTYDLISAKKTQYQTIKILGDYLEIQNILIIPKEVVEKGLIFDDKLL